MINLRERFKPDMSQVLDCIFSHAQVAKKNQLVIMLIVSGNRHLPATAGEIWGQRTFSGKEQRVNILDFMSNRVSVPATRLCHISKVGLVSTVMNGCDLVAVELCLKKQVTMGGAKVAQW